jgi:RNA polymerase sigma-70 factor (ECF subfamily)
LPATHGEQDSAHDDQSLMHRFIEGDARAFDVLYDRYRVPLYNYVRRMCGDTATGDDIYQETWAKLIAARDQFKSGSSFKAYLFRIAHNLLMDQFRGRAVRKETSLEQLEAVGEEPAARASEAPDVIVDLQRRADRLIALIDELPPEQRETFLLRREYDHGLEAIAELTGVPVEAVRSRLRYALKKLKAGLQD